MSRINLASSQAYVSARSIYHRCVRKPAIDLISTTLQTLPISSERIGPPKGEVKRTEDWVRKWNEASPIRLAAYHLIQDKSSSRLLQPVSVECSARYFNSYALGLDSPKITIDQSGDRFVQHSELFVSEIPDGRVYSNDGYVITPDDYILARLCLRPTSCIYNRGV